MSGEWRVGGGGGKAGAGMATDGGWAPESSPLVTRHSSLPVNAARGEVTAHLAGAERRLCLTLGALAEMEAGLGVGGVEALAARMRGLSAGDLMVVLAALLRGGGEHELARELASANIDPKAAAEAVAAAFAASV